MATFVDTFRDFGRIKLALIAVAAVLMIGFFAFITLRVSSPAMTPLYTGLPMQDSAKIVTELESAGIPYEIRANGAEILVPGDRALRLRMSMAEKGLPSGGSVVGYEIFDKADAFGSSTTVMNINMVRALEGELARTIGSFNQIEHARVHLVMPKREVFTRDKQDPSASVAVTLRGNMELSKNEISAITHLLAAAVPSLKTSRVTVVDSHGRLLARGDGDDSAGAMASNAEEFRIAFETRMQGDLERLVEKVVGAGKVRVQIASDINFDRVVTNKETFDPEGQVARSTQSATEKGLSEDKAAADAVTVENQLPAANAAAPNGGGSKSDTQKSNETTNYEISKTVQNHVKEGGSINRLSVAVLVDGNYTKDADDKETYAARSDDEIKRIEGLVKSAMGFDEKRGDSVQVVNMQFSKAEESAESASFLTDFRHEFEGIIQTLIIAAVALLAIMLVIRPAVMQLIRTTGSATERTSDGLAALSAPNLPGTSIRLPGSGGGASGGGGGGGGAQEEEDDLLIDIGNVKGRIKQSSLRKIAEVVDRNPDEALNVMRQWMMKEAA